MHLDTTILLHTLPALVILLLAEVIYMIKEHRHDNKDMLSSLGLILGHLPISVVTRRDSAIFLYINLSIQAFHNTVNYWWAWVICFFSDDFSYYWFHRCSHQVRFLWASQKVHHSSEKLTLSSGLRTPWTSDLTGTFLFWAWMPLIGIDPYMVIFMKSVSVIYQFWMHTETIGKLPGWFEAVFNTPSHHIVHHSSNVEYLDKNHAGTLIIWDKLFGTYQKEIFKPKYGLTENIKSYNPFVIAFHEWKNLFKDFKRAKKLKDCFHYLLTLPAGAMMEALKLPNNYKLN
jgi:sterol desaturase/sphingolipid hydroxylase (fatty acid hydroxylase superfamily)